MASQNIKNYIISANGLLPQFLPFYKAQGLETENLDTSDKYNLYSKLKEQHDKRLKLYSTYINTYNENTILNFADINESSGFPVTFKLARLGVNKHAFYLMNKGFLIESNFIEIQDFLQDTWRSNNFGEREYNNNGLLTALHGGITGDSFLFMYYSNEQDKIVIENLQSYYTFPYLEDEKMKYCIYYKPNDILMKTSEEYFYYYEKSYSGYYVSPNKIIYLKDDKPFSEVIFDLNMFPVYHIQNFPNPFGFYGVSDLASIIDLNTRIDKLITNISDIIEYHSAPVTIIKGAKPSELVKGVNRVWFLPNAESEAYNLELGGSLTEAKDFLERLTDMMLNSMNLNKNVFGKEYGISNTPASGLALTLNSVYEYMEMKRITYGTTFLEMNKDIIKMGILRNKLDINKIIKNALDKWESEFSIYDEETKNRFRPFLIKPSLDVNYNSINALENNLIPKEIFETYITWFPPFSRDEKISNDIAIANVNSGLWSKRHARSYIGMNEKESILMDKEINFEQLNISEEEIAKLKESQITMTNKNIKKTGLENVPEIKSNNSLNNLT